MAKQTQGNEIFQDVMGFVTINVMDFESWLVSTADTALEIISFERWYPHAIESMTGTLDIVISKVLDTQMIGCGCKFTFAPNTHAHCLTLMAKCSCVIDILSHVFSAIHLRPRIAWIRTLGAKSILFSGHPSLLVRSFSINQACLTGFMTWKRFFATSTKPLFGTQEPEHLTFANTRFFSGFRETLCRFVNRTQEFFFGISQSISFHSATSQFITYPTSLHHIMDKQQMSSAKEGLETTKAQLGDWASRPQPVMVVRQRAASL